jgi:hypothetical protein
MQKTRGPAYLETIEAASLGNLDFIAEVLSKVLIHNAVWRMAGEERKGGRPWS